MADDGGRKLCKYRIFFMVGKKHFDDLTDNDKHMSEHLPATKSLSRYLNMLHDIPSSHRSLLEPLLIPS